ncbi:MAG TPA: hypothetical protein VJX67_21435, partial [Blastocatellia bacterium]|nr:hypothetical protein [Blastocatellia bacterium]
MSKVSTKEKVRVFTCPGCGASQEFNPKDGGLTCPYCGHKEAIASGPGEIKENSYLQYLKPASNALERIASDARDITCAACGAVISFTGTELADTCPFCGTNIATPPKPSDPTVAPEGVVPFVVTRDQATQYIGGWLRSRWFAPQALKKFAGEETIGGVYLPYWTYDSNTKSFYTGERGEHYWETETYTETDSNGNTVTKTRQVMKTRWYRASGDVSRWFDDV